MWRGSYKEGTLTRAKDRVFLLTMLFLKIIITKKKLRHLPEDKVMRILMGFTFIFKVEAERSRSVLITVISRHGTDPLSCVRR